MTNKTEQELMAQFECDVQTHYQLSDLTAQVWFYKKDDTYLTRWIRDLFTGWKLGKAKAAQPEVVAELQKLQAENAELKDKILNAAGLIEGFFEAGIEECINAAHKTLTDREGKGNG